MAKSVVGTKNVRAKGSMTVLAIIALLCLTSCVSGGMDLLSRAKVDRTSTSGAVPQAPVTTNSMSDETSVQNAVTSADLSKTEGQLLPWANAATGSVGVIEMIVEQSDSGLICRQFRTTRHAYDGIARFDGKTCMIDSGNWKLVNFRQVG
jgi:hypothetical protein